MSSAEQDRYRVLLVEDYEIARTAMKFLLEDHDCDVIEASCGNVAIERCAALVESGDKLDLIVTDLGLPDIRGNVLVEQIRAQIAVTAVIYCSGCFHDDPEVLALLEADPTSKYLEKPISFEALVAHIRSLKNSLD